MKINDYGLSIQLSPKTVKARKLNNELKKITELEEAIHLTVPKNAFYILQHGEFIFTIRVSWDKYNRDHAICKGLAGYHNSPYIAILPADDVKKTVDDIFGILKEHGYL